MHEEDGVTVERSYPEDLSDSWEEAKLGQRRAGREAANGAASMHPMKCTSVSRYRSRKDGDYSCEIKGGVLP